MAMCKIVCAHRFHVEIVDVERRRIGDQRHIYLSTTIGAVPRLRALRRSARDDSQRAPLAVSAPHSPSARPTLRQRAPLSVSALLFVGARYSAWARAGVAPAVLLGFMKNTKTRANKKTKAQIRK